MRWPWERDLVIGSGKRQAAIATLNECKSRYNWLPTLSRWSFLMETDNHMSDFCKSKDVRSHSRIDARYLKTIIVIAVVYFVVAKFGLSFAFSTKQVTAIWPSTGVAVAAMLLGGYRVWPAIYLGAFAINALIGGSVVVAATIAIGNTLAPAAALFALRRLLDINMPGLDGVEVLRQIKVNSETRQIQVIILTTTDDPREINRCYELGCSVCITKPVDPSAFIEAIKRLGLFISVVSLPTDPARTM
jgi:CheY-like chemotaxis protein